jgi:hypothetical protein
MMDTQKSCNNCYPCVSDDPNDNFCDASASCIDNSEWVPTVEYVEILESELQQMKEINQKLIAVLKDIKQYRSSVISGKTGNDYPTGHSDGYNDAIKQITEEIIDDILVEAERTSQ